MSVTELTLTSGNNLEAWQSVQSNQDGVFPDGYDGINIIRNFM